MVTTCFIYTKMMG